MELWEKALVNVEHTIADAIEILQEVKLRVVLVVDDNRRLLGTITDGDVRRGLIRRLTLDASVCEVMEKSPVCAKPDTDSEVTLTMMEKKYLTNAPVLNEDGIILGLVTYQELNMKQKFNNPVVLMAGGFGARLHPLTLDVPKPLLPIGGKPILQIIIEQFIESGFKDFYISTHYKSEQVREYFNEGKDWGVSIKYIHEKKALGTAGALGLLPADLPKSPLIVMNADVLSRLNLIELLQYHEQLNGVATMCVRKYDMQVPYGVIVAKGHRIEKIMEKPKYSHFVNAGIYVLDNSVLENLYGEEYLDMTDLLQSFVTNGEHVNIFPIHENWIDIGRPEDYLTAQTEVLIK